MEMRKKHSPKQFPDPKMYTQEEMARFAQQQMAKDRAQLKRDREKDERLSRRRIVIDRSTEKPKVMSQEEYTRRYKDQKRVKKPPVKRKKRKSVPKRKMVSKRKGSVKKSTTKKKSVLSNGFFVKSGRKFILEKKFSNKSEAEKVFNKLRSTGYHVELSAYSPKKHKQPYMIFKGPLKKKR